MALIATPSRHDGILAKLTAPPAAASARLDAFRRQGGAAFGAAGLPGKRVEAWRYTDLTPLAGIGYDPAAAPMPVEKARLPALLFGREAKHRLVFVNGGFRADLSDVGALAPGVTVLGFAEAARTRPELIERGLAAAAELKDRPLAALNAAGAADGLVLHVAAEAKAGAPIEILWVGTGAERAPVYHPRCIVVLDARAHLTLVEHHVGLCIGGYFANHVTDVSLGEGAVLRHCKVQDEAREAVHVALTDARLAAGANFDSFVFALGGRIARNEIHVRLGGEGAHCRLNGAYLGRGDQLIDNTTVIDHAVANTASKELYKGVLDGKARGVFQGKIVVRPDAQKTDGQQLNRALLLSDKAEIACKPELEILADDVKCSHGASAGEIDESQLFYLRARGIPREEARRLLVEAFLGEVIDSVALAGMRLPLERNVERWMRGA